MSLSRSLALMAAGAGLAVAGVVAWQARDAAEHGATPVATEAEPAEPLALDAAQRARLGIVTGVLAPAQDQQGRTAFARAVDAGPLAAIDSEILIARAAAAASAADAARLADLARQDQSASARSVQAAVAQATADRARLALAERRVALEFGPGLARLGSAARAALIADIAAGRAALLRIDSPGQADTVGRVTVGDPPVPITVLGTAATSDARIQGAAFLGVLRGPGAREAAAGRLLAARIAGGGRETGTILPSAAVVRMAGQLWAYVPKGASFERRALAQARPVDGGWFTTSGVRPGNTVVIKGAGTLLGIENGLAPTEAD